MRRLVSLALSCLLCLLLTLQTACAVTLRTEGIRTESMTEEPSPLWKPPAAKRIEMPWVTAFLQEHSDIHLQVKEKAGKDSTEALLRRLSQPDAPDVLLLDTQYQDVQTLIESGALLDLSADPEIMAQVQRMHPNLVNTAQTDGRLYAVPMDILASFQISCDFAYGYYRDQIGYSPADAPTSFDDFLTFLEGWCQRRQNDPYIYRFSCLDYVWEHPLLYQGSMKESSIARYLLTVLYRYALAQWEATGTPPQWNNPDMLTLLDRAKSIGRKVYETDNLSAKSSLFSDNMEAPAFSESRGLAGTSAIPARLTPAQPLVYPMRMQLLAINANTDDPESALALVRAALDAIADPVWPSMGSKTMDDRALFLSHAHLFADASGDCPFDPARITGYFDGLRLADSYDPHSSEYGSLSTLVMREGSNYRECSYESDYIYRQDDLTRYQQSVPCMIFPTGGMAEESDEVASLIKRFAKDEMTTAEFAQVLDEVTGRGLLQ